MSKLNRTALITVEDLQRKVLPGHLVEKVLAELKAESHREILDNNTNHNLSLSSIGSGTSQMLNVVVSDVVISVESTLHGEGSIITPTRVSVFPRKSQEFVQPVANEMDAGNQIRKVELLPRNKIDERQKQAKDRHTSKSANVNGRFQQKKSIDNSVNVPGVVLEASFEDINNNVAIAITETPILQYSDSRHDSETTDSKIFTLATDAFLIRGTANDIEPLVKPRATVTTTARFTEMPRSSQIHQTESYSSLWTEGLNMKSVTQPTVTIREHVSIPRLLINTDAPVRIHYSTAPELKEIRSNKYQHQADPVINQVGNAGLKSNILNEPKPELNEIVDVPIKEALINDNTIEWLNIFNTPKETLNMSVGDIAGLPREGVPMIALEHVHAANRHHNTHHSVDNNLNTDAVFAPLDGFVADTTNLTSSDISLGLADTHIQNALKFFDKIMGDDSMTHPSTHLAKSVLKTVNPPTVSIPNNQGNRNLLGSVYYPSLLDSNIHRMNQMQEMTNSMMRNNLQNVMNLVSKPFQSGSNIGHTNTGNKAAFSGSVPQIIKKRQPPENRFDTLPQFQLRAGFYNGRPAVVMGRSESSDQQPWAFLRQVVQKSRTSPAIMGVKTQSSQRERYTNHLQRSRNVIVHNRSHGYGWNHAIQWKYPQQASKSSTPLFQFSSPRHRTQHISIGHGNTAAQVGNTPGIQSKL